MIRRRCSTLHSGQSFPYGQAPANATGVVLPDRGTANPVPVVFNPSGTAGASSGGKGVLPGLVVGEKRQEHVQRDRRLRRDDHDRQPDRGLRPADRLLLPQLLMLQELWGRGSAPGCSFAGVNLYVQLGRGQDSAWSATSAGQDITDTYRGGSSAGVTSMTTSYMYHGQCVPMDVLQQNNSWTPTIADPTPAGSYSLITYRTKIHLSSPWRGLVERSADRIHLLAFDLPARG